MKGKVNCTCGWSWNKSDSSKKDMYICHECGRDNSNNIPKAQEGIKSPNVWAQEQHFQEKHKKDGEYKKLIGDTGEEAIDIVQRFVPGLKNLPGLGSSFAVGEAEVYNQDPSLSDELGMIPLWPAQAASLMLLETGVEKENMHKFAKNKYKGKDLTELVPEKEVNPKVIDKTYVAKPKIGKIKETKTETESKKVPYKEKKEFNKVEIDKTRTTKPRIDNNYKPETKSKTEYKFNIPNISYRDDSFVMPNELNDIKIDNTYVAKPKYNGNLKNGGWLDNYNDSQASAPEGMVGDGFSNVGRNSSPAWGGQFQNGGTKKPIPSYKDFLASIKKDKVVDYKEKPRELVVESTKTVAPKLQKKLTKQQAEIVQEDFYKNPVKQEGITSGDKRIDFLYNNEWLMDVPIVGSYIKDQAKQVAKDSGGRQIVDDIEKKAGATGFTDELYHYTGNTNFIRNKSTLLDQYFSKDALLPKSKYKPKDDYLEFLPSYSIKGDFDKDNQRIMALNSELDHQTTASYNNYEEFLKNKKPIYIKDNYTGMAGILGADLGSYKTGIAWDDKMNLPYMSVSDAWDFEPSVYSKKWAGSDAGKEKTDQAFIQSYLLHKAGNPFKVYDRFYFDPKTKQYIPDDSIQKRQTGGSVYPVNYVPQAQNGKLTFLQPTSDKLPQGYRIPYSDPSSERAMSIGGEDGEPAYLIPSFKYGQPLDDPMGEFRKTGEHLGGPFETYQEADEWERTVRHPAVERKENIMFPQEKFEQGGNIPKAQGGWFETLKTNLNPYNWGVEDYSKEKNFNKAYSSAKKSGEEEFVYKGKRYNTKYAGTPRQEAGQYITNKNVDKPFQVNVFSPFSKKYLPGHIEAQSPQTYTRHGNKPGEYVFEGNPKTVVNFGPLGNNIDRLTKDADSKKSYYTYGANDEKFDEKAFSLPVRGEDFGPSGYNLFFNNCADNTCDAFGIPRSKGIEFPENTLKKIKEKYPTIDVTGRTYKDYKKMASKLEVSFPEKILPQAENILGIANSPDLKDLSPKFIRAIQGALSESGYDLPNSTKKSESEYKQFDGVFGPETKKALEDWQKKHKSLAMGGSIPGAVGFTYARTQSPAPSNGKYAKKTKASAKNGAWLDNYEEAQTGKSVKFDPKKFAEDKKRNTPLQKSIDKEFNTGWRGQYKQGGIIKDDMGQWNHPGEITEIGSNQITMEGVPYDVLGVSDTGDTKLMKPGKNYKFKGKKVTEYPMAKNGINQQDEKTLEHLDQLTNFTNYNKPQPGGWLNKYN